MKPEATSVHGVCDSPRWYERDSRTPAERPPATPRCVELLQEHQGLGWLHRRLLAVLLDHERLSLKLERVQAGKAWRFALTLASCVGEGGVYCIIISPSIPAPRRRFWGSDNASSKPCCVCTDERFRVRMLRGRMPSLT